MFISSSLALSLLDIPQETTDFWKLAHMFGAKCHTDLTPEVTHVVTAKVDLVSIAEAGWGLTASFCSVEPKKLKQQESAVESRLCVLSGFNDSIALWRRQDEEPYLFYASNSPPASDHPIFVGSGT